MKYMKRFESSNKITLRNSIGEIVADYLEILAKGDIDLAKEYLIEWTGGDIKEYWDGEAYTPATIITLKRFITPASKKSQREKGYDAIEITSKLLDEIKNERNAVNRE